MVSVSPAAAPNEAPVTGCQVRSTGLRDPEQSATDAAGVTPEPSSAHSERRHYKIARQAVSEIAQKR